jgi:hypothetical protein
MRKSNTSDRGREARLVVHDDEHAIVKEILSRVLGDDVCFANVVSGERSESGRAEDRLVLAGFLRRLERQFEPRDKARGAAAPDGNDSRGSNGKNGQAPRAYRSSSL